MGASRVIRRLSLVAAGAAAFALATRTVLPAVPPDDGGQAPGDARGWMTDLSASPDCDMPYRAVRPGVDESSSAYLGDTRTTTAPGCNPTWISDVFDCGASDRAGGYCTVTFDATVWLAAGERAVVVLATDSNLAAFEIPGSRGGKRGRYAAAAPGSGGVRLLFAVWTQSSSRAGTRSILMIDNVESYSTNDDITSASLTPVPRDEIVIDPETVATQPLPAAAGPDDCNDNGLPDAYEISQGVTPDRDRDGTPDTCQEPGRHVDWVLLALATVVLVLMLFRLARRHRSSHV